jgi:hypothetical protein
MLSLPFPLPGALPVPHIAPFAEGGFVAHKVTIGGSRSRFSAWFSASGALIDAERIDTLRRSFGVRPGSAAWRELERKGAIWAMGRGK